MKRQDCLEQILDEAPFVLRGLGAITFGKREKMWLPISPPGKRNSLFFTSARTVPVQCPLAFSNGEPINQYFKDSDSVHQSSFSRATLPIGKTKRALNGLCTGIGNFHIFRPQGLAYSILLHGRLCAQKEHAHQRAIAWPGAALLQ